MSDTSPKNQAALTHQPPPVPIRQPHPGEILFAFERGADRFRCELRSHGDAGVEAQFFHNDVFLAARLFHPRLDPTRPPRALAIAWAEEERKAIERGDE